MILPRSTAVALAIVSATGLAHAEEPAAPRPGLTLQVSAPPAGPWTMTLANEGTTALRVAADVRFLSLEVIAPPDPPAGADAKPHHREKPVRGYPRGTLPACRMPADMRPAEPSPDRALVLQPGERYVETFLPTLLCGAGKLAGELVAGAVVYPSFGWPAPRHTGKKGPQPPFVAEPLKLADASPPVRHVEAAGILLSASTPPAPMRDPEDAKEDGTPPEEAVDERAPRLVLRAARFADAANAAATSISVTLSNVGKRKTVVHLRRDDLALRVAGPGGSSATCAAGSDRRGASRDFFETLGPGDHRSFVVQIAERCPSGTFDRPGVYTVTPTLVLRQRGAEWGLSAFVGRIQAEAAVELRVRTGRAPFYASPPRVEGAKPTAAE